MAVVLAAVSARSGVNWNDSSRLATVEALVDYHTLAIDDSYFVDKTGFDKLYIDGHYYSDKSPVPALLMAILYQILQWCTGLTARTSPEAFARSMALGSSGLAYVVAVWCIYRLTLVLRLPLRDRVLLTCSFALATVALPYARQVNNHIQLLAVSAAIFLVLARLGASANEATVPWLFGLGSLAGLGYAIDLATGPVLLVCLLGLILWRYRHVCSLTGFALGAAPWFILHHTVNYAVGGTFQPANAVPEYLRYTDTWAVPVTTKIMTGFWNHPNIESFLCYAAEFLIGPRGFLNYNLPLFLAIPGLFLLWCRRVAEWRELLVAAAWSGGTWLAYAALSNNYSGLCLSIRWLVPLLVPGYLVLALLLRDFPGCRPRLLVLTFWGTALLTIMWSFGTWYKTEVPYFWPIQVGALLSWLACEFNLWRRSRAQITIAAQTDAGDAAPPSERHAA